MIRLYRYPLSGHCHRAELFLRLLDLPFQCVEVDLKAAEQKRPEFVALNRFAQVPVLDDDGAIVADSNAILVYLALRYAPEHWYPRDPLGAAEVQRWLSAAAGPLAYGAARARVVQVFRLKADPADAIAAAHRLLRIVDETLAAHGAPFLCGGNQPTIADLALYTYTAHAPEGNVSLDEYAALRAWLDRVQRLPRFAPMPASKVGLAA